MKLLAVRESCVEKKSGNGLYLSASCKPFEMKFSPTFQFEEKFRLIETDLYTTKITCFLSEFFLSEVIKKIAGIVPSCFIYLKGCL